ncbi:hypothetical protein J6590_017641 [Homalodisca vitripennis]|nr:hypothetical protein J6590_017641 [Homalodisca vitripennis]
MEGSRTDSGCGSGLVNSEDSTMGDSDQARKCRNNTRVGKSRWIILCTRRQNFALRLWLNKDWKTLDTLRYLD